MSSMDGKPSLHEWALDAGEAARLLTPQLAIYPDGVALNIDITLALLDHDADRWQPHVKTAKLLSTMEQLRSLGVTRFKCATTLELLTACRAGAKEALLAFPSTGSRTERVREIAAAYPDIQICAMVENCGQVAQWQGSPVALFIDINPGMDRTGIDQWRTDEIVALASRIRERGIAFGGLHYYDGQHRHADLALRCKACHAGYEQLLRIAASLEKAQVRAQALITSGTPALPCALSFPRFRDKAVGHRVSPGTIVYGDLTSREQLPPEWGYRFAALVITTVVSHPAPGLITCDAGHKAVSADAGIPNCAVLGRPELEPLQPSEEHLPIRVPEGVAAPEIGEILYLVPKHICPTVNLYDSALLVRNGRIAGVAKVTARGREPGAAVNVSEEF